MPKIPFHIPFQSGDEKMTIGQAIEKGEFSGDGHYTHLIEQRLQQITHSQQVLFTTSCTHSLELAALLLDIKPGDEIIMPSFTFVSTANAFVLRGAKIVFVDIRPDTMNIDEKLIAPAITTKTKAIVIVHYAGVSCEMDVINELAKKHYLAVVEDAAQCLGAYYKGQHLGTLGHFGALSFHATKNIHCGEGGALLIQEKTIKVRAEILREKGTNRGAFLRGEVDKYSWVDIGSSYLAGEIPAAFLSAQLHKLQAVTKTRVEYWHRYMEQLEPLSKLGLIELPVVPDYCQHNGHIFYVKCKNNQERQRLINHLAEADIGSAFHYVPLHSAKAGKNYGRFHGEDRFTSTESERLLRLPLYPLLNVTNIDFICARITGFYT